MKTLLFVLLYLSMPYLMLAQTDIKVPVYPDVLVFDHPKLIKYHITLSLNMDKELVFNQEKIELTEIKDKLFNYLLDKIEKGDYPYELVTLELIIDKNLSYTDVKPLLFEVRKHWNKYIHFTCNSATKSSIKNISKAGFRHKLNTLPESNPVTDILADTLNARILKKYNDNPSNMIPPPPPPPFSSEPEIKLADLRKEGLLMPVYEIEVNPDGTYTIDNQQHTREQFSQELSKLYTEQLAGFILKPHPDCKYEDFLFPLLQLRLVILGLYDELSLKELQMKYSDLSSFQRHKLGYVYTYIMVIDD